MYGECTAEIGIELQRRIHEKYGDRFIVCIDHVSDKTKRRVAILELEMGNDGVNISYPDIAILEINANHGMNYSGEIAVLCEVEERSRGDVKQLCGDLFSMFLAKRAKVVSKDEYDKTYFLSVDPNILTVYSKIDTTSIIDNYRWQSINQALINNKSLFKRSLMLKRADDSKGLKDIVITDVLSLLDEWVILKQNNTI